MRPLLGPYIERHHGDADWTLSARPGIQAEFGSGYVLRLVNERRAAEGLPPFAG